METFHANKSCFNEKRRRLSGPPFPLPPKGASLELLLQSALRRDENESRRLGLACLYGSNCQTIDPSGSLARRGNREVGSFPTPGERGIWGVGEERGKRTNRLNRSAEERSRKPREGTCNCPFVAHRQLTGRFLTARPAKGVFSKGQGLHPLPGTHQSPSEGSSLALSPPTPSCLSDPRGWQN